MKIRDSGQWRDVRRFFLHHDGGWRLVQQGFVREGGQWQRFFMNHGEPFAFSGTFASNMDGWAGDFTRTTTSAAVRTSPGGVMTAAAASSGVFGDSIFYTIPRELVHGMRVTIKYWHRRASGTTGTYRTIGSLSGQVDPLPGSQDVSSTAWRQFAAYRDFPNGYPSDVDARIYSERSGSVRMYFDDWEITGVPIPWRE